MLKSLLLVLALLPMAWRTEREAGSGPGGRACTVVSMTGEVRARLSEEEDEWAVRVGIDNQPGSLRYLRVGKRIFQTDKERFDGAEAAEIVARLKRPGVFVLEWATQAEGAKRGGLYQTGNFAEQAEACEIWMKGKRV